jgi:hypothetical protein
MRKLNMKKDFEGKERPDESRVESTPFASQRHRASPQIWRRHSHHRPAVLARGWRQGLRADSRHWTTPFAANPHPTKATS